MNKYSHYQKEYSKFSQLRRSLKAKPKLMGVCAGISHQFDWDLTFVRVAAVISLAIFTVPTLVLYIIAGAIFY